VSWFGESWAAGDELPPMSRTVTRGDVAAYADASGDRNPLHLDDDAARAAGFDGVIAHGMFTMGHLAAAVAGWVGEDAFVRRMNVQFRSPVSMGETIVARAIVRSVDTELRTVVLEASVTVDRGGRRELAIRRGEVEVVAVSAGGAVGRVAP
jgi:acyl dehydratase